MVKIHMGQTPNFQPFSRYNSAANCSVSPEFGTECEHVTQTAARPIQRPHLLAGCVNSVTSNLIIKVVILVNNKITAKAAFDSRKCIFVLNLVKTVEIFGTSETLYRVAPVDPTGNSVTKTPKLAFLPYWFTELCSVRISFSVNPKLETTKFGVQKPQTSLHCTLLKIFRYLEPFR